MHSFHTLLGDLATLTRNVVRLGRDRLTAILATPTRQLFIGVTSDQQWTLYHFGTSTAEFLICNWFAPDSPWREMDSNL